MPLVFGRSILGFAVVADDGVTWTTPVIDKVGYDGASLSVSAQDSVPQDLVFKPDGTKVYMIGSAGDDVNEYNLSTAWNISTASYNQNFVVSSQDGAPGAMFFKDDGTKMYIVGYVNDNVYEYNLSTAWDISTASYSQSFDISSQVSVGRSLFFKDDGTKMFVGDSSGLDVNEYALSTAWDVSTASFTQLFSVSAQSSNIHGLYFSPDGTEMFICDTSGDVYEYSLTTGWDVSTASYSNNTFDSSSQAPQPSGISFKTDGSKMYLICLSTDKIWQYSTLSYNPDIANATYDSKSVSIGSLDTFPSGLAFKSDGTKVYFGGVAQDKIFEMDLSTAWDISTASGSTSLSVSSQDGTPLDVVFSPDGTKMMFIGRINDSVYEYTLSTAWDVTSASYVTAFSVASQDTLPWGLAFKPDGTEMYVGGDSGDQILQYTLSTGWDLSTASYTSNAGISSATQSPNGLHISPNGNRIYVVAADATQGIREFGLGTDWDISTATSLSSFSVTSQTSFPAGVTFKTDGSKMYVIDRDADNIFQYSTAAASWTNPDIANASYDSVSFNVGNQETYPTELTFNNDGSKMYVLGLFSKTIYQYSLSTKFDVSTASYDSVSFSAGSQLSFAGAFVFNNDGTKLYATGEAQDAVFQYSLSTAYNVGTASYDNVTFSVSSQEGGATAIEFSTDGTKMYILGWQNDTVFQYTLTSAFDLSTASYASKSFSIATQESTPHALRFNPDGTKMYVIGTGQDKVFQYTLSTAFDVSTASYDSVSFSVATQESVPYAMAFKNDGSKLYVVGDGNNTVHQYST